MKFGLFDSAGQLVAAFDNEGDAEQFQNRKRPDTVKRRYVPNVFGEPDDMKMALYSSWGESQIAHNLVSRLKARYHFNKELGEELQEVLDQLAKCSESVRSFAPAYHRETLEGWAQEAAEANHP